MRHPFQRLLLAAAVGGACCWTQAAEAQLRKNPFSFVRRTSQVEVPPEPALKSRPAQVPSTPQNIQPGIVTEEHGAAAFGGVLTLELLEDMALNQNPSVAEALAVVRRAQGKRWQAGLYPNPSAGYVGSEIGNDGKAGQEGYFLEQEFVTAGKLGLSQSIASQERRQAECALAAQQTRVRNAVRREFYALLTAERMRQLSFELVDIADVSIRATDARLKRGEGTRIDLLQAKIEAESARQTLTSAENARHGAWKRLKAVVGAPSLPCEQIDGDLMAMGPELSWAEAWDRICAASPQLNAARHNVRRAQAAVRRAEVEPIPNIIATGMHQYDNATQYQIAGLQIGVAVPIFNRNQGNIYSARAEVMQASRQVQRLERALERNLASAYQEYATTSEQAERFRDEIVPAARESLDASRTLYEAGEIGYLQLQTAQRTYTQMNLQYVEVLGRYWKSRIAVEGMLLIDGLASPESLEPDSID